MGEAADLFFDPVESDAAAQAPDFVALPEGTPVEPVTIRHVRDHRFKKKPVPEGKEKPSPGCAVCNAGKTRMVHVGSPPSLNAGGSGGNHFIYQAQKGGWEEVILERLAETTLPRGLARVHATGLICFDRRGRRDQGNFRVLIEKALGDALVRGGYLRDDDWDHYEFGDLRMTSEKGVAWTEFEIVGSADPRPENREGVLTLL